MPVTKASNGKWRIGSGRAMYRTEAAAERAYSAYRAKKHSTSKKRKRGRGSTKTHAKRKNR